MIHLDQTLNQKQIEIKFEDIIKFTHSNYFNNNSLLTLNHLALWGIGENAAIGFVGAHLQQSGKGQMGSPQKHWVGEGRGLDSSLSPVVSGGGWGSRPLIFFSGGSEPPGRQNGDRRAEMYLENLVALCAIFFTGKYTQ